VKQRITKIEFAVACLAEAGVSGISLPALRTVLHTKCPLTTTSYTGSILRLLRARGKVESCGQRGQRRYRLLIKL
jgi:hypothetical protein